MKLNLKKKSSKKAKNSAGLKMTLLMHAEKIVIGLAALCVAWLIYGATKLESLPEQRQPPALQSLARQAKENIGKLDYASFPDEKKPEPVPYDQAAVMKQINPATYKTSVALNPPEFPRKTPREDPQLLPLESFEVSAGVGLFAYQGATGDARGRRLPSRSVRPPSARSRRGAKGGKDEEVGETVGLNREDSQLERLIGQTAVRLPAGAVVKGHYWAAVMAKVPWSKQLEEYVRTFRDAEFYRPEYDVPTYAGYIVERAEVGGNGKPVWKRVQTVTDKSLDNTLSQWAGTAQELADPHYVDPLLTYPLPIRAEKQWDDSVLHSEVPRNRQQRGVPGEETAVEAEEEGQPDAKETPENEFGPFGPRSAERGQPGMRARGRFAPTGDAEEERKGARPTRRPARSAVGQRARRQAAQQVPFLFFRFLDFTVQPGKQYRYRVQLVLYDPNDSDSPDPQTAVPARYLSDTVLARRAKLKGIKLHIRMTDWSEPTPVISIPYPGWLLAGPVKAARPERHHDEPTMAMIVQMLDLQRGLEGVTEIPKMRRGTVGNLLVKTTKVIEYGRSGPTVRDETNFTFRTNTLVLDIQGGQALSRRNRELTVPGQVLLLDPSGRLIVRSEQADRDEYDRLRKLVEAGKQRRSRGSDEKKAEQEGGDALFGPGEGSPRRGRGRGRRRATNR